MRHLALLLLALLLLTVQRRPGWRSARPPHPACCLPPLALLTLPSQEWYHWRREMAAACRPNPVHYALAALQRRLAAQGRQLTLVTQNVDRLHQAAGSMDVLELHGRCMLANTY